MAIETISVIWAGKFDGQPVTINESDFDPKLHKRADEAETDSGDPDTIPADFPGVVALAAAGITLLSELDGKTADDLTAINGIGAATAKKIIAALTK